MALEKQAKQIGEFSYEVTQLGAKDGNRVLMKIAKSVGPVFLIAASAGSKSLDAAGAADAIRSMNEEDFDWIVGKLASATTVQLGERAPTLASVFDLHFAGKYLEELEWLEFALEVNFGPFFLVLKAKAAARVAASGVSQAASNSTSPITSTGPSSGS